MSRGLRVLGLAIALIFAVGAPAAAQSKKKQAREHYRQGKAHFDAGAYDEAIRAYTAAYALAPKPVLLFNIGLAHRAKGDAERAVEFFRKYLEADPKGKVADEAREYVDALSSAIRARKAEEEAERERKAREAAEAELRREQERAATGSSTQPAPPRDRGKGLRIAGLITAGAGVLSLGLGIKFGLDAQDHSDALSNNEGEWTDELLDRAEQGETAERNALLFTGLGAAAVATGTVLYVIGHRRDETRGESPQVTVIPTRDGAAFAITGSF